MVNKSGVLPAGHRILVKPLKVEQTTESGIVIATEVQMDRERLAQIKGRVIEIGPTAYMDQPEAWCSVGQLVTFGKYSGLIYKGTETLDGEEYRLVNDLDIVATHREES